MFQNCYVLNNLDVSSFNTGNVQQMEYMFQNCYALSTLDFSNFDFKGVKNASYMFSYCNSLKSVGTPTVWNMNECSSVTYMFDQCLSLQNIDLSGMSLAVISSAKNMFRYCRALMDIRFPQNLATTALVSMNGMFYGCYALKTADVSGFNVTKLTDMQNMFYDCTSLVTVDLSRWTLISSRSST